MFTDMVGYSALTQRNEMLALELLEHHRQLLREVFPKHNGQEIETAGDAFLVEFDSAVEATRCAVEMQNKLGDWNREAAPDRRILIRIGIHAGDVVHKDGKIMGDTVNIAARIEPLAEPGGICLTQQVYDQLRNKIPEPLVKIAPTELKNISARVEVYRVILGVKQERLTTNLRLRFSRRALRTCLGILTLSALVAGVLLWQKPQNPRSLVPSIAVLPFDNYSSDTNNSYLSEGITEDLTTILGQVEGLRVPGRTSTQISYDTNKKDFRKIGTQLGVAWVLEGSIRELAEKNFRVNAQLISTEEKNRHLWSTYIDTSLSELKSAHFHLAREILNALKLKCPVSLTAPPSQTVNPEAIKLFLRGRQQLNRRTKDGLLKGQDLFEQALLIEPTMAEAYSGQAECYNSLAYMNYWAPKQAFPKSMAASRRAIEINTNLAEAHAALGYALLYYEWKWAEAETEFKQAILLNPKSASAHDNYSVFLAASKRPAEAREQVKMAQELDPLSLPISADMAFQLYYDRQYGDALQKLHEVIDINDKFPLAHFWLGRLYTSLGSNDLALAQFETADVTLSKWQPMLAAKGYFFGVLQKQNEALKVLREFDAIEQTGAFVTSYGRALVYAGLGEPEKALDWLDKALGERSHWLIWLELDPRWDTLRDQQRFRELVAKVGRPPTR